MQEMRIKGRYVAAVAAAAFAVGFAGAAEARTGGTPAMAASSGNAPAEVQRAMRSFWHGSEVRLSAGGQAVATLRCVLKTSAELSEDCQDVVGEGKRHLALLGRHGADRAVVRPFDRAGTVDPHPTARWKLTRRGLVERELPMFGATWPGYREAGFVPAVHVHVFDAAGERVGHRSTVAGNAPRTSERGER